MRLARKNFLVVSGIVVLSLGLLVGLLYFVMPIYYNQAKKQELKKEFVAIVDRLEGQKQADIIKSLADYDKKMPNLLFSLFDQRIGDIYYPELDMVSNSDTNQVEQTDSSDTHKIDSSIFDELGTWTYNIKTMKGKKLHLQAAYASTPLSDISQALVTFYPFILLFIIILAIIIGAVFASLSTRRIRAISQVTRQMKTLQEELVCCSKGQDEIATLANDINHLYQHLLTSIQDLKIENERTLERERQQAEFLRATSHELKTPIASMMGLVEGMRYNVGVFKDHDTYLKKCDDILQEQNDLVASILEATRLSISNDETYDLIELKDLLEPHLPTYNVLAEVKGFVFSVSLQPSQQKVNSVYFVKAVKNILDNAFRYSKKGSTIRLSLTSERLIVENQPEYMLNKEELEKIFQPFYRPDFARSKKDGGTGLGLFLVKQILVQHGLDYSFSAINKGMVRFVINLVSK
ncbi:sensor histidine kinase [Streptococcus pseudoporcinus]|uniref:sensor histidine kinase n=1 Tax=Streptococcus pseudoporcinus TaxID=361101 RepID=UPI000986D62C|nr:HAMP domain-containing sensor histidine kinase [Streptococcus pseudoporcinus]VUC64944.1 two-component sensor [Streptococcus pseudoporcinus]VUC95532.1 two-component sensor [Streptococcus pseudoporcinus]VUC95927.1 two-component sensor [Streptococcus pseudoporcinus]